MTLSQLEYFVTIVKVKSFNEASERLGLTQPTLSMQIKKLEEELGIQLLDRSKQPLSLTVIGEKFLEQAEKILFEKERAIELIHHLKEDSSKELKIAIIPTLAPYLLPLIIQEIIDKKNEYQITIWENHTHRIIQQLEDGELDLAILATPIKHEKLEYSPVFYEKLFAYFTAGHPMLSESEVNSEELDLKEIWLLNDGNCLSTQIKNLCGDLIDQLAQLKRFNYKAGSLETIKKMVEWQGGFSVFPELMVSNFSDFEMEHVRSFKGMVPCREISVVTNKLNAKKEIIEEFTSKIVSLLPKSLLRTNNNIEVLDL